MGTLTTHVLDTAQGKPGAGMVVELFDLSEGRKKTARLVTNDSGRTDTPVLSGEAFRSGEWELVFFAGDYFRAQGMTLPEPPFLDRIPIRFGISAPDQHYHIPLLVSPWSFTTYRGS